MEAEKQAFIPDGEVIPAPKYRSAEFSNKSALFRISHQPVLSAKLGESIKVSATVTSPEGVKWVRLRFRSVNQHEDYQILQMLPAGEEGMYEATVPAARINPKFDFMYFIEVMDKRGRGAIYPDLHRETPYKFVKLVRDTNGEG